MQGALPEREAVVQEVVAEIRVRDRGHIKPVCRVGGRGLHLPGLLRVGRSLHLRSVQVPNRPRYVPDERRGAPEERFGIRVDALPFRPKHR